MGTTVEDAMPTSMESSLSTTAAPKEASIHAIISNS
jgi:hypothetical protein